MAESPAESPDVARLPFPSGAVVHARLPAWEAGGHASRSATSSIGLSFTRQACDVEASGRAAARVVEAGGLLVVGPEPLDWLRVDGRSEIVEVSLGAEARTALADELSVGAAADLAELALPADPVAWVAAARLRSLARRPDAAASLEAEALAHRLYAHLLLARFGGRLRERGRGALDPRRLARVAEHVEAHLDAPPSLAELARAAALSPFHFHRSFSRATGCTPHAYVALRRAERARALLAAGRPAGEVAALLGYGSARRLRGALRGGS